MYRFDSDENFSSVIENITYDSINFTAYDRIANDFKQLLYLADSETNSIIITESTLRDKIKPTGYDIKDEKFKELLHKVAFNKKLT